MAMNTNNQMELIKKVHAKLKIYFSKNLIKIMHVRYQAKKCCYKIKRIKDGNLNLKKE